MASATQTAPQAIGQVGDVLAGKFRVERVLGEGGMGVVCECTHLLLDERVALKFLRPQVLLQSDIVARFAQEARAAAKLKSEHVARVLDVGEERGIPYIVMEFLEGKDLEELVAERGPLPIDEAVELVIQAAEGISEAHTRGIIHRDLKPANLFLAQRSDGWPTLKILDFGISKAVLGKDEQAPRSGPQTMSILGSPYYMSPEQLRSTRDVDRRTDIWALGAVLFELLTGRTAFPATEFVKLVNEITDGSHTSLRELRPDAPDGLEAVIDRALAKDAADRFQSAGELALALLPFTTSKRSRVIATHAVTMTRSSGIDPNLPLPSALPPGMSSGSLEAAIPAAPATPRNLEAASGHPSSSKRPVVTDPALGATTPILVPEIKPAGRESEAVAETGPNPVATTSKPRAVALGAGALVVLGLGIVFATRRAPEAPTQPPSTLAAVAPTSSVTATPTATASEAPKPEVTASAVPIESSKPAAATSHATAAPRPTAPPVVKHPTGTPSATSAGGDLEIRRER